MFAFVNANARDSHIEMRSLLFNLFWIGMMMMRMAAFVPRSQEFLVDHPFVIKLLNKECGSYQILFSGRIKRITC